MTWDNMTKTQKLIWLKKLSGGGGGGTQTQTVTNTNRVQLLAAADRGIKALIRTSSMSYFPHSPQYTSPQFFLCNNGIVEARLENGETVLSYVGDPERIIVSPNYTEVNPIEPYQEASVVPLFSTAGEYRDTHNLITGEVVRRCRVRVLDGSEEYTSEIYNGNLVFRTFVEDAVLLETLAQISCSHTYQLGLGLINGCLQFPAPTGITTVAEFKAFIASQLNTQTPFTCIYPLKTPFVEKVTPQPLSAYSGIFYVTSLVDGVVDIFRTITVTYYKASGGNIVGSAIVGSAVI